MGIPREAMFPIHLLEETDEEENGEIKNDFIYLVDVEKREERKLCYHGTSWRAVHGNPQDSHPHPCFTEDNRYVIFVSDKEGKPWRLQSGFGTV